MRGLTFHELWITPHRTPLRGDEVVMLFLMQAIEIVLRVKYFLDVDFPGQPVLARFHVVDDRSDRVNSLGAIDRGLIEKSASAEKQAW